MQLLLLLLLSYVRHKNVKNIAWFIAQIYTLSSLFRIFHSNRIQYKLHATTPYIAYYVYTHTDNILRKIWGSNLRVQIIKQCSYNKPKNKKKLLLTKFRSAKKKHFLFLPSLLLRYIFSSYNTHQSSLLMKCRGQ